MVTQSPKPSLTSSSRLSLGSEHRNEVMLIGELAGEPEIRVLPSGDEVTSFRLTVRTDEGRSAKRRRSGSPSPPMRSDSIECAAWRPDVRLRMQRYAVGDVVEVSGALRHRYWRGPGGLASRYEIEVVRVKKTGRAATPAAARRPPKSQVRVGREAANG